MRPDRPAPAPAADRPTLAAERTALGWQRSSLSLAVIAALLLLHGVHRGQPLSVAAAGLVAAGSAWAGVLGSRLYRRRMLETPMPPPAARPLLALVAVTVGAAAVAAAELIGSG